ncbi:MAG: QueT transporter family protein [Thermoprotei archaeon]|nr:MAG: QueT transporter family protein [Thermoprotei archaeon]
MSDEKETITISTVRVAIIAAGYAAVTILIAPIAYGPIQMRISDVLMPIPYIPYFGWSGIIGLTIGTLIANLVSPYSIWDVILGTLANFISGLGSYYARRIPNKTLSRIVAVTIPVLVVTFLIGYILLTVIFELPLLLSVGGVFVGEAVTAGFGGYILITQLEKRFQESVE